MMIDSTSKVVKNIGWIFERNHFPRFFLLVINYVQDDISDDLQCAFADV